jgi:hypothetical protein
MKIAIPMAYMDMVSMNNLFLPNLSERGPTNISPTMSQRNGHMRVKASKDDGSVNQVVAIGAIPTR